MSDHIVSEIHVGRGALGKQLGCNDSKYFGIARCHVRSWKFISTNDCRRSGAVIAIAGPEVDGKV